MTRLNIDPRDVQIVFGRHMHMCGCRLSDPKLIDTRCVEAYYIELDAPQLGTPVTRPDAAAQAVNLAQAGDMALTEGDHAEATAHYAGAAAWAAVHALLSPPERRALDPDRPLAEQFMPPRRDDAATEVIPRVEPQQWSTEGNWCYCVFARGLEGQRHPLSAEGCTG